ncbi:MAG: type II secretion system minor pseudopilin GspI [Pseudomonadota bacterium]
MAFRPQSLSHKRGFTLIEVLVAFSIVSITVLAISMKVSQSAKVAKRTQEITYGRWVAMNALTELRLKPGLPSTGRSDGDEEMAGAEWRWAMDISQTPVEGIRRVDITVARAESPDKSLYSMSAFMGNNTPDANLRPWSGWPDANTGGQLQPPTVPGTPPLPGQRPDPRRGLERDN